jgi:hypothetical protein
MVARVRGEMPSAPARSSQLEYGSLREFRRGSPLASKPRKPRKQYARVTNSGMSSAAVGHFQSALDSGVTHRDNVQITQVKRVLAFALLAASAYSQSFRFSPSDRGNIWGRGTDVPRHFFDEFLPALFTRTLEFNAPVTEPSSLDWIFTGDEGGITVHLRPGKVQVTQRYYDSCVWIRPT